jgi:hypothetical protein
MFFLELILPSYTQLFNILTHTLLIFVLNQSITITLFIGLKLITSSSQKLHGKYLQLSSYILKFIASFNAIFLFPFSIINFSNIFVTQHNIGTIGDYIINTQLSYYIIDTIYSLLLNNKQAIIHHFIGLGMINLPISTLLYKNAFIIANFGTQGSTLFVRIFDIQRLFLEKYNVFEKYLVFINIWFYFTLGIFVMYPMTFYVIYLFRYKYYNIFFIFQLLYNFYWDRKLIYSYFNYQKKIKL